MFRLLFEGRERVLLTRYSGVFSSDDITKLDAIVVEFVAREGYVRNIFDFTDVDGMAIPRTRLFERGRRPRMNPGKDRVIVAPQHEIQQLYGDYARAQIDIGNGKLMIVQTLTEAFDQLRLRSPDFKPIAIPGLQ